MSEVFGFDAFGMPPQPFDLVIAGGHCVTPSGLVMADIGIVGGKITAIGDLKNTKAAHTLSAKGLHVLPGVIDSQVHFREPGLEYKEDLESGTRGAALGGVTTIFEMPNTKPQTLTADDLSEKLRLANGRAWTNHAFFMGAAASNINQLATLEQLPGCSGVKIFMGSSTGGLLVEDDDTLRQVLQHGRRRVAVHCEDEPRLRERLPLAKEDSHARLHPVWRDEEVAFKATRRIVALSHETGRRIHTLHITTKEEIAFLAAHKDLVTVEVLPQHLTLSAPECYERLGNYAQMNPPIRSQEHQDALWWGIDQGIVDVIGSDHAPHTREEKDRPYPKSPAGLTGVQTFLPLLLNHVNNGKLSLLRLVDLVCTGPARVFNVASKGRLAVGYDADVTLVDLNAKRTITHDWIASKCGWTPYDGMAVSGWPVATVVCGHVVMHHDQLLGSPIGQPVRFTETLQPNPKYGNAFAPVG